MFEQLTVRLVFIKRWCTEKEFRNDINFRRWGVRTSEISGWVDGDPGDANYPPDWRWTLCQSCGRNSRPDPVAFQRSTEERHITTDKDGNISIIPPAQPNF